MAEKKRKRLKIKLNPKGVLGGVARRQERMRMISDSLFEEDSMKKKKKKKGK